MPTQESAILEVPSDLPPTPNAMVVQFVPHGPVLDRAVCAITHGGMGGTQKALARGVPVCSVPFGRDQFEVARRVEVARSGTRLPAKKLTAARLSTKVQQAMTMTAGARMVAAGFAATGGVARGCRLDRATRAQPRVSRRFHQPALACRVVDPAASSGPSATIQGRTSLVLPGSFTLSFHIRVNR